MLWQVYSLEETKDISTEMIVEGGYREAENDDMKMVFSKVKRGMNFPCPEKDCVLTFSTREEMNIHQGTGKHDLGGSSPADLKVEDKVKRSWIKGLSGKVESRKSGNSARADGGPRSPSAHA